MSADILPWALCVLFGVAAAVPHRFNVSQQSPGTWRITLRTTGGFAGVDRQLDVTSTREITAIDRTRERPVKASLTADEVPRLESLIERIETVDASRSLCRDCFVYELTVQRNSGTVVARLDDTTLDSSPLAPLIKALVKIEQRVRIAPNR